MRIAVASLAFCAVALASGGARAQSVPCDGAGTFPCGYQIDNLHLQPSPALFKFQARVSQAKLPTGQGLFHRVLVALKRGNQTLCSEEFSKVRVSDGTMNLEIGRNIDCELDQVVAANRDLAFQVCIGGTDNCLRPIPLGTDAYAFKSSFAVLAQEVPFSDLAGQATYMQRATADRDMVVRKALGIGYFDFSTPDSAPRLHATDADFAPFAKGGFLTWTPVQEGSPTLHIAARDAVRDTPMPLGRLLLMSNSTESLGRLVVRSNGLVVNGAASIDGATTVVGMLSASGPGGSPSGAAVRGPGTFGDTLGIGDVTTVAAGGLHVTGDSDHSGNLSLTGALTSGSLTVTTGGANVTGDLALGGNLVAAGSVRAASASVDGLTVGVSGATVSGPLTVTGPLSFTGGVAMGGVAGDFNVPGSLTAGALQVNGATTVPGLAASGNIGAAGKNPNSGYPSGWTGGLHTKDLYAEGTIGIGPGGAAIMSSSGTLNAPSAVISGNLQVQTINGKLPGAGDGSTKVSFRWTDRNYECATTQTAPDVCGNVLSYIDCTCPEGSVAVTYTADFPGYGTFKAVYPSGRALRFETTDWSCTTRIPDGQGGCRDGPPGCIGVTQGGGFQAGCLFGTVP